jgi:hypothetical protein
MRRAAFVLALVIGLMGATVLPIQAHDGSDDSRVDTRHESKSDDHNSSRESSVRVGRSNNPDSSNSRSDDDRNRAHGARRVIRLSGENEVPAGDPDGIGWARLHVRPDDGTVCYTIKVKNLDAVVAAHIHTGVAGVNGGVVVDLAILAADTKVNGDTTFYSHCVEGLDASLLTSIRENRAGYYLNVHTTAYPDGAIRGQLGKSVSS